MKKITKLQAEIADRHLLASLTNNWSDEIGKVTVSVVTEGLLKGDSYHFLHKHIVSNNISITSQLMASPQLLGHITEAYKRDYRKGWKVFLTKAGII